MRLRRYVLFLFSQGAGFLPVPSLALWENRMKFFLASQATFQKEKFLDAFISKVQDFGKCLAQTFQVNEIHSNRKAMQVTKHLTLDSGSAESQCFVI